jgi:hypothetical protein
VGQLGQTSVQLAGLSSDWIPCTKLKDLEKNPVYFFSFLLNALFQLNGKGMSSASSGILELHCAV